MKQCLYILLPAIFLGCSSRENGDRKQTAGAGEITQQPEDRSLESPPVKTIVEFLKWYRENESKIGADMVNNDGTLDTTKFYSVNFDATEEYLQSLLRTGFISEKYASQWRQYFKRCDQYFREYPENDGPPTGFEYNFIMLSQDWDDDLAHVDEAKVRSLTVLGNNATVALDFPFGNKLVYDLAKENGRWKIVDIKN